MKTEVEGNDDATRGGDESFPHLVAPDGTDGNVLEVAETLFGVSGGKAACRGAGGFDEGVDTVVWTGGQGDWEGVGGTDLVEFAAILD